MMLTAFQSSVASTVRKALQFFGMALTTPANPFAFEKLDSNGTDIERYIENLVNGYNAHGAARMQQYRVEELYHCKERTEVGHEYTSAKVIGPDSGAPFYIFFERFRGPNDLDKPSVSTQHPESAPAEEAGLTFPRVRVVAHSSSDFAVRTGNLSKESSPLLTDRLADDKASMSLTPTRTGNKDEIHRAVIFKDSVPLYVVAVLAATVHHSQVKYGLSYASCYFYAATIMAVMEKLHSTKISHISNSKSTRAELGKVPFVKKTPMSKICSAPKIQSEALETIITSYKVDLDKFERNVRSAAFI